MKEEEHKDQDDRSSKVYCAGLTPLGDGDRCMRAEGRIWQRRVHRLAQST